MWRMGVRVVCGKYSKALLNCTTHVPCGESTFDNADEKQAFLTYKVLLCMQNTVGLAHPAFYCHYQSRSLLGAAAYNTANPLNI